MYRSKSTGIFECCVYAIAAEQKARATYEHLMRMTDNPDILDPLRFLRQREINHFQRFGECLMIVQDMACQRRPVREGRCS